jgi:hypothetical protein
MASIQWWSDALASVVRPLLSAVRDPMAGVEIVPAAVEVLGDRAELDDQDARQVGRSLLAPFLAPEPQQGLLVLAHDDSGGSRRWIVDGIVVWLLCCGHGIDDLSTYSILKVSNASARHVNTKTKSIN